MFFVILCLWLLPGIVAWLLSAMYSHEWGFRLKDLALLAPLVNLVIFGLVIIVIFDEWINGLKE